MTSCLQKKPQTKADLALENAYLRAALTLIGLDKLTGIPVPPAVSAFACLVVVEGREEHTSGERSA